METKVIYTNQIQIAMQAFDFTLLLNTITPDGKTENQAIVYLSPQHAKGLLHVLVENVQQYEELFGTINLEPNQDRIKELEDNGRIIGNNKGISQ